MTKKGLLIGINYTSIPQSTLHGCIDDIENMTKVLVEQYGYERENIIQLRDDIGQFQFQPTRTHILELLNRIIADGTPDDEIWIHYSGHGSQIPDMASYRADHLDEVIVPIDYNSAGFITDKEIFEIIRNSKCKTVLVFDSCHSGSICDLQWSFEFNGVSFSKSLNVNKTIANPNVFCLSGCKDAQTSADSYSNELHEAVGAFTDALIHCLALHNYNVNIMRLYGEICLYLHAEGFSQKPMLSCSSVVPNFVFSSVVGSYPPAKPYEMTIETTTPVVAVATTDASISTEPLPLPVTTTVVYDPPIPIISVAVTAPAPAPAPAPVPVPQRPPPVNMGNFQFSVVTRPKPQMGMHF